MEENILKLEKDDFQIERAHRVCGTMNEKDARFYKISEHKGRKRFCDGEGSPYQRSRNQNQLLGTGGRKNRQRLTILKENNLQPRTLPTLSADHLRARSEHLRHAKNQRVLLWPRGSAGLRDRGGPGRTHPLLLPAYGSCLHSSARDSSLHLPISDSDPPASLFRGPLWLHRAARIYRVPIPMPL